MDNEIVNSKYDIFDFISQEVNEINHSQQRIIIRFLSLELMNTMILHPELFSYSFVSQIARIPQPTFGSLSTSQDMSYQLRPLASMS